MPRRLKKHAQGKGAKFTRSFGARKIVYSESCQTRSSALKREAAIKKYTRHQKLALIGDGPLGATLPFNPQDKRSL